jgi:hypothetical protein
MASVPGFLARQAGGLMRARTLTAGTGITVSNATGAADPTIAIDTSVVPRLGSTNTFSSAQTLNGTGNSANGLQIGGTGLDLAAGQIKFPATQVASSDANTLDDYEEGTWTPVIGGNGGTSGQAYTLQSGRYIKIGLQVTVWFSALLSTLGTLTSTVEIQGLPFTIQSPSPAQNPYCLLGWDATATNYIGISGFALAGGTAIALRATTAAATTTITTTLAQANLTNTTLLTGVCVYRATA